VSGRCVAATHKVDGDEAPAGCLGGFAVVTYHYDCLRSVDCLQSSPKIKPEAFVHRDLQCLTPRGIAPELLLVYLRFRWFAELLDLHATPSMYPAISNDGATGDSDNATERCNTAGDCRQIKRVVRRQEVNPSDTAGSQVSVGTGSGWSKAGNMTNSSLTIADAMAARCPR